jgi:hypothetical protein
LAVLADGTVNGFDEAVDGSTGGGAEQPMNADRDESTSSRSGVSVGRPPSVLAGHGSWTPRSDRRPPPPLHRVARQAIQAERESPPFSYRDGHGDDPTLPRRGRRSSWLAAASRARAGRVALAVVVISGVLLLAARAMNRSDDPSSETSLSGATDDQPAEPGQEPSDELAQARSRSPGPGDSQPEDGASAGTVGAASGDDSTSASSARDDVPSTAAPAVPESTAPLTQPPERTTSTTAAPPTSPTSPPTTTTTAPPAVVPPPDLCETQTQDNSSRGVEVKYLDGDAFASSFRFYGADRQLLYDTTTLADNPSNRVFRDGYYEREWDVQSNPSGFEPRDVHYVAAVHPEGESAMTLCVRTNLT